MKTLKLKNYLFSLFLTLFLCTGIARADEFLICNFPTPPIHTKEFTDLSSALGNSLRCNALSCRISSHLLQQYSEKAKEKDMFFYPGFIGSTEIKGYMAKDPIADIDRLVEITAHFHNNNLFDLKRLTEGRWSLSMGQKDNPKSNLKIDISCSAAVTKPRDSLEESTIRDLPEASRYVSIAPYDFSSPGKDSSGGVVAPGDVSPPLHDITMHFPSVTDSKDPR